MRLNQAKSPTTAQEAPKSAQEAPRTSQRRPRTARKAPKTAQHDPKTAQDGPRGSQEGRKTAPHGPNTAQERPKRVPRQPKEGVLEGVPGPPLRVGGGSAERFRGVFLGGIWCKPQKPLKINKSSFFTVWGVWGWGEVATSQESGMKEVGTTRFRGRGGRQATRLADLIMISEMACTIRWQDLQCPLRYHSGSRFAAFRHSSFEEDELRNHLPWRVSQIPRMSSAMCG